MSNYKDTINLPKTSFSMKANLAHRELHLLQHWQKIGLYKKIRAHRKGAKKFILHDGPPYANGAIHLGHAVNKILKDIIIKANGLNGFDAPYVPGWDCHGLPIELMVEKKIGRPSAKLDVAQFRAACRTYANKQVDKQRTDFKRLGVLGDWDTPYLTMDFNTEANTLRTLGALIAHGHVVKGNKPVAWCIDCGSALAEAEVEYKEKDSPSIDTIFRIADEDLFWRQVNIDPDDRGEGVLAIAIWTTTPWTLPANQAVAVHPQFEYQLLQCRIAGMRFRLILAAEKVAALSARYPIEKERILACFTGQSIEHIPLQHPFYDRLVPITLAQHVTLESGTGAVHIAPGHGQDDYIVGKKYQLVVANPVDSKGYFSAATTLFAGQHIFTVNEQVIKLLDEKNALLYTGKIQHSYPHCWRHKTPIIFRATPQWFISMDKKQLRKQALTEASAVKWAPEWGQKRIIGMIQDRQDWCISRQRSWGVPIAVFTDKKTGTLHPKTAYLIKQVAKKIEKEGVEAWFNSDREDWLGTEAADYEKGTDILDVWFDSGATHATVLNNDQRLCAPADLYLEGSDQYRGWFQSSLLTAVGMDKRAPYEHVLTHGFTVDASGIKMSKSKGNVIAPQQVIQTLGADVLRLWVAATDYRKEMNVSDEILKRIADTYRRIRNTVRYLLANLNGFDPEQHQLPQHAMLELDRWAVNTAAAVQSELVDAYACYRFHRVYQRLHHFCTVDMGGFYLDIIKDRMYTMPANSMPRRSAQTAMYHIIEAMVRWLSPILSFTAEEIWQFIPGPRATSVFLTEWYNAAALKDEEMAKRLSYWQDIIEIRNIISKELEQLRAAGTIGSALEAEVAIYADNPYYAQLKRLGDELRFVLTTSAAHVYSTDSRPAHACETTIHGVFIHIAQSKHKKCVRCWHLRADVGGNEQHPTLCGRCIGNISGDSELRHFA